MNGHGHHQGNGQVHGQHGGLQPSLIPDSVWPDGDDSVESVDASFSLGVGHRLGPANDQTQPTMIQSQNNQQGKRLPPFDTTLLASATPMQHSPKRARTQRQPHHTPTPTPPQPTQAIFQPMQNSNPSNSQSGTHDMSMNQTSHPHTTPQTPSRMETMQQQLSLQPPSSQHVRPQQRQYDRSPQYPMNDFTLPSLPLPALPPPYRPPNQNRDRNNQRGNRLSSSASMPIINGTISPQASSHQLRPHRAPGVSLSTLSMTSEDTEPEVVAAGLTESQRRTEAVLRLENEELSDDDMLIVLQLFEDNIEAVDVYLALRKPRVRSQWLKNKVRSLQS